MSAALSFQVGALRCHLLDGGMQRLDGGAMFGVVPKPLWERRMTADERNRIPLAMRCLLIEHDAGLILVDTGAGNKESEKFRKIYALDNAGETGPTVLEDSLAAVGYAPSDVRMVINTHLHFDHAGGNTYVEWGLDGSQGGVHISFPEATYVVQRHELAFARRTNERTAASYLPHNFEPIDQAGRWKLVDGEVELVPGITLRPTPGHVPGHQSVMVHDGGDTLCYLGDLVPTTAHLPLPWIMGYDLEPLVTLESKRALLGRAEAEGWRLVFEHDPEHGVGRVVQDGRSYGLALP